jgi:DNA modification methylase
MNTNADIPWMPYFPVNQIVCCDVMELLRSLPSNSIHCIVTSPPYWGLRDYQTGEFL